MFGIVYYRAFPDPIGEHKFLYLWKIRPFSGFLESHEQIRNLSFWLGIEGEEV